MATLTKNKLRFVSRPFERRVGLIPVTIAIAISWLIVAMAMFMSLAYVKVASFFGPFTVVASIALAVYLSFLTATWIKQSHMRYELEIGETSIKLIAYDKKSNRREEEEIDLQDVLQAEYYEARDVASLLLRGRVRDLDIPLWSFDPHEEEQIVAYVRVRGVRVIGIPVDLPEQANHKAS